MNGLLTIWQQIFFAGHKIIQVESGSIINWSPRSGPLIQDYDPRIRIWKKYMSATLLGERHLFTVQHYRPGEVFSVPYIGLHQGTPETSTQWYVHEFGFSKDTRTALLPHDSDLSTTEVGRFTHERINIFWEGLSKYCIHKAHIYEEYHSVCPLLGIGTLPPPLSPASVPLPPESKGGGHTRLRVRGWGSPNSDDWRKAEYSAYSVSVHHSYSDGRICIGGEERPVALVLAIKSRSYLRNSFLKLRCAYEYVHST